MDVRETGKVFEKHSKVETPRQPLFPAEKNNGTNRRSRTREVSSRFRSPAPSRSSGPGRFPSPNIRKSSGTASSESISKRAVSSERSRPSTPPSPPSPSTPAQHTSADTLPASRKVAGGRLPEALWPSTMRSLSVSFQSDTFSLPISKREKPVGYALASQTLKPPSSNVAHKQVKTPPASRKPTPERSPLKGKNAIVHSENSKPDGVHARLVDQHQRSSQTLKVFSNSLSRSVDLSDKTSKTSTRLHPTTGAPSLRRMSMPGRLSKPLQNSASDAVSLLSSIGERVRIEFDTCSVDDNPTQIPRLVSTSLLERAAMVTSAVKSQSLSAPASRAPSPIRALAFSSSSSRGASPLRTKVSNPIPSRGASPSRTKVSNPTPSRGVSPSRIRPSSPTRQSDTSTSVLSFISDMKKGASHIEDAHHLRLLYNRHLQWRYANARVDVALHSQTLRAEKILCNVWQTTLELWDSVTEKRIHLQQLRLELKLCMVLNEQMAYLDDWALIDRDHTSSLSQAMEDLEASTLRLPFTGGARADIETAKAAVCSAVDMMQAMGSSICSILSKVEGMNCLVSELADMVTQQRAMLDECEALLASAIALQVEEYSLRIHLIQLQQAWKSGNLPVFGN